MNKSLQKIIAFALVFTSYFGVQAQTGNVGIGTATPAAGLTTFQTATATLTNITQNSTYMTRRTYITHTFSRLYLNLCRLRSHSRQPP